MRGELSHTDTLVQIASVFVDDLLERRVRENVGVLAEHRLQHIHLRTSLLRGRFLGLLSTHSFSDDSLLSFVTLVRQQI